MRARLASVSLVAILAVSLGACRSQSSALASPEDRGRAFAEEVSGTESLTCVERPVDDGFDPIRAAAAPPGCIGLAAFFGCVAALEHEDIASIRREFTGPGSEPELAETFDRGVQHCKE